MHRTHYAAPASGRQQKRAEFHSAAESPGKPKYAVLIGIIVVLSAVVVYLVWSGSRTEGAITANTPTVSASGQDVRIPLADVSDGKAKFFTYALADNREVSFFVLKSSDGVYRAAFNACDVCYDQKLGYHQEGDDMVCNKCGQHFPSDRVNEVKGGCNPTPLARIVEGDHLIIKADDLRQGAFYF